MRIPLRHWRARSTKYFSSFSNSFLVIVSVSTVSTSSVLYVRRVQVGGWWNTYPIPFAKSVRVTVRADPSDGPVVDLNPPTRSRWPAGRHVCWVRSHRKPATSRVGSTLVFVRCRHRVPGFCARSRSRRVVGETHTEPFLARDPTDPDALAVTSTSVVRRACRWCCLCPACPSRSARSSSCRRTLSACASHSSAWRRISIVIVVII